MEFKSGEHYYNYIRKIFMSRFNLDKKKVNLDKKQLERVFTIDDLASEYYRQRGISRPTYTVATVLKERINKPEDLTMIPAIVEQIIQLYGGMMLGKSKTEKEKSREMLSRWYCAS